VRVQGVALVAVLWIVSALAVLVTGLVAAQRADLRQAGDARARLVAGATAQAAVHLVLQRLTGGGLKVERLMRAPVQYGEVELAVEVMPLTGLVDLNSAPEPLLLTLFVHAGGLDEPRARALAAEIVARRQPRADAPGRPTRLDTAEELLAVPGVDYDLFAKLRPLVTTESGGTGRVNALAAPEAVLLVLARGRQDAARRVAQARDSASPGVDTSDLDAAFIDASLSSRYRFTVGVPMADGSHVVVVRDVDARRAEGSPAPWQTLRVSSRRVQPGLTGEDVPGR
jgi:general secretion pathway protein K